MIKIFVMLTLRVKLQKKSTYLIESVKGILTGKKLVAS